MGGEAWSWGREGFVVERRRKMGMGLMRREWRRLGYDSEEEGKLRVRVLPDVVCVG
jgi:hypothetical protein